MACVSIDVSTPVYEGPFDLLLQLILKEQVDLYEIDLARSVDAYLAELEKIHSLDFDIATEFLLIAATLVMSSTLRGCFEKLDRRIHNCAHFADLSRILNLQSVVRDILEGPDIEFLVQKVGDILCFLHARLPYWWTR